MTLQVLWESGIWKQLWPLLQSWVGHHGLELLGLLVFSVALASLVMHWVAGRSPVPEVPARSEA